MPRLAALIASLSLAAFSSAALAGPTIQDAEAFVKRATAYYDKEGRYKAMADFNRYPGKFGDAGLYMVVYDMNANVLAHVNRKMLGRNIMNLYDSDGQNWVRERIEAARDHAQGYQDVRQFNPATQRVELMRVYWERHGDLIFAAGATIAQPDVTLAQKTEPRTAH